jgi:hypothetical protein
MLQTSVRIVMTGVTAVTLGALSGWVLMDKLQPNPVPAATAAVVPAIDRKFEEPTSPARRPEAATPARAPATTAPPAAAPAPAKVAAPAPAPAAPSAPAATPARETPGKPEIRIDPERRQASLGIGGSRFSAAFDGSRVKLKGPGGINFEFDID